MTDPEVKLLSELRRLGVWNVKGGSFEVHLDGESKVVKIDLHTYHKVSPKLSTALEVQSLTG